MAEKSKLELIVDLVKALVWPVLVVCGVFWLGNDFKEILKNRTVKIAGVFEIGDRITEFQNALQKGLVSQSNALAEIAQNSADSAKVRQLAMQALHDINTTRSDVNKEIRSIQKDIPKAESVAAEPPPVARKSVAAVKRSGSPDSADGWEEAGFDALIARDAASALKAFAAAEKIRPDYHNVAEISLLLVQKKRSLDSKDEQAWRELYRTILKEYSWGMPPSAREEMRHYLAER